MDVLLDYVSVRQHVLDHSADRAWAAAVALLGALTHQAMPVRRPAHYFVARFRAVPAAGYATAICVLWLVERDGTGQPTGWLGGDNCSVTALFAKLPRPDAGQKRASTGGAARIGRDLSLAVESLGSPSAGHA